MILKLAGLGSFDRPMTRIVNPRRHLVRQQFALHVKKFYRQDARIVQLVKDSLRVVLGKLLNAGRDFSSRCEGKAQNPLPMMVLRKRVERSLPRGASDGNQ